MLRFPAAQNGQPNFYAKPIFELHVYCGDERGLPRYEFYDLMHVEDEEWERYVDHFAFYDAMFLNTNGFSLKASGEQLDDRIVEVHWDPEHEHWRMMRFRDDKPAGNYKTVVENIIKSIADGVEKDTVCAVSSLSRTVYLIP